MIYDQANELRQLVRSQPHGRLGSDRAPEIIAVTGAQHGVGTTTVSVNLAMALALAGRRAILVDADLERGTVAQLCGITERSSVIDVLAGRRSIHEVLLRGPVGVLVVPGVGAPGSPADCSATAQQRLIDQLRGLAVHADVVIIDTGSGRNGFVRRFWQAADAPLVVTTPEPVAIMECYATIKVLLAGTATITVRTLINRAPTVERATEVQLRIASACRRFLGAGAMAAGHVPEEPLALPAAEAATPLVLGSPHCEGARAMERLAAALWPVRRSETARTTAVQNPPSAA
ncbi:MAG TPA: AAA family ATPase [Pirellulales bacterium]|jgi:flagellar biosynthesis protein FlhG|nr:AAA family ATPase [Pirellulales bacterium]